MNYKVQNPKDIGELTEQIVITELMKKGYIVSKPLGDNQGYDIIVDKDNMLSKIQIKTGRLKNGTIKVSLCRCRINTKKSFRIHYNSDEVDIFAVYCYELNKVYIIPFSVAPSDSIILRIDKPKNNIKTVRYAVEYELV